jgi:hypothetical protein
LHLILGRNIAIYGRNTKTIFGLLKRKRGAKHKELCPKNMTNFGQYMPYVSAHALMSMIDLRKAMAKMVQIFGAKYRSHGLKGSAIRAKICNTK